MPMDGSEIYKRNFGLFFCTTELPSPNNGGRDSFKTWKSYVAICF